jgi:hypothetical protein
MGVFMGMMDYFMVGLVFGMGTLFSVFGFLFSVGVEGRWRGNGEMSLPAWLLKRILFPAVRSIRYALFN